MSLMHRVKRLEAMRKTRVSVADRMAIDALEAEIAAMSDEELRAIIAAGEAEPSDPELDARIASMTNDELSMIIIEGRRNESSAAH